jgi:fermentation-respiration switch protein FrsA (DUF1100 family)
MAVRDDGTAVEHALRRLFEGVDGGAWDVVRAVFAPEVELDYGAPERLAPDAIVARWQPLFGTFDRTEHRVRTGAVRISGDVATVSSTFDAEHVLEDAEGGPTWTLRGRYEHELYRTADGWKITRMRMVPEGVAGNGELLAQAQRRAGLTGFRTERVAFDSGGDRLAGVLHLPEGVRPGKLDGVVVTGSWTTVKEQMPAEYARRLAAAGFAALVFDFRGFGESGGAPREYEDPARKAADLRAAARFLRGRAEVDARRVSLFAICASTGYAALASASDPDLHRLVLVAPWLHDAELVRQVYGGDDGVRARLAAADAAERRARESGQVDAVPAASSTDASAAMYWPALFLDYYLNPRRGAIPQWRNRFAVASWRPWLTFDAPSLASGVRAPTLVVHSEAAAIPAGARRFEERLRVPHESVWLENRTQFRFYDDAETIDDAVQRATRFLRAPTAAAPGAAAR